MPGEAGGRRGSLLGRGDDVRSLEPHAVGGLVVGLLLRRPFRRHPLEVVAHFARLPVLIPAEHSGHQPGGDGRRGDAAVPFS